MSLVVGMALPQEGAKEKSLTGRGGCGTMELLRYSFIIFRDETTDSSDNFVGVWVVCTHSAGGF